jgi:molybdenum cofactor biosynthesis enzyme MoaA
VVDSCNLCCPFCAFDKRLTFGRSAANPSDILRLAQALAAYQARTKDRVMLSWLGGEPLSWKPLRDLTLSVRALDLSVSATTNGTALGNARLRRRLRQAAQLDSAPGRRSPHRRIAAEAPRQHRADAAERR